MVNIITRAAAVWRALVLRWRKPTKVYVVTAGDYSDYHIVAVFSARHKAEAARFAMREFGAYRYTGELEEYDLDAAVPSARSGLMRFKVWIAIEDSALCRTSRGEDDTEPPAAPWVGLVHFGDWRTGMRECICFDIDARGEGHAMKIASELRARAIATGDLDKWRKRDKG